MIGDREVIYTSPFEPRPLWERLHVDIEHWRAAVGYEGLYVVSSLGRIASLDRVLEGPRRRRHRGRVLRPTAGSGGYPSVSILGRTVAVHKIVGDAFSGPKPDGMVWRHFDDVRANARAYNIVPGTLVENQADAKRNGRLPLGEEKPNSVLSNQEAAVIKALYRVAPQHALAKRFGISRSAVADIHRARSWSHVQPAPTDDALRIFNQETILALPHLEFIMSLERIERDLFAHGLAGGIYFSDGSAWWSHYRSHAFLGGAKMKCPLGGQVYFERDWEAWLAAAKENPTYYGRHGLNALVAAHHSNCRDPMTGAPFAAHTWEPYNAAIDAMKAEGERVG